MHNNVLYCCWTGNYLKFYNAIREAYPDIQMISNCDGSSRPLDHPADLFDFHVHFFLPSQFYLVCCCLYYVILFHRLSSTSISSLKFLRFFVVQVYTNSKTLFSMRNKFDGISRDGPKVSLNLNLFPLSFVRKFFWNSLL